MGTTSNNSSSDHVPPATSSTVILMAITIADTTWRLFVPSVGLTLLGLWADKMYGTKPWLMIAGVIVGSCLAILLVKLQMKKVRL